MDTGGLIQPRLLLVFSVFLSVVSGGPIDCTVGGDVYLGAVEENYEGDVEVVTGIPAGTTVRLEHYLYPAHLEFLELIFTLGETTATVRTKKPLDADVLDGSDGSLYYAIVCTNPSQPNTRQLAVNDINDNGPIFTQDHYNTTVSETTRLDAEVLRAQATDADITSGNNRVTYSIEPAPEDFTVTNSGIFLLKNRLNYNVVPWYNFIVTASDNWGLNSTATVLIEVEDFDNLNPSFSHNMYKAFIQENQSGPFRTIEPEQIKAQDGDTGINMTVTYSISGVFPDQYESTFSIDSSSGVVSVVTPIDREKMTTEVISVSIKATQTDDSSKTANAVVSVTVEDVNDNAPQFDQNSYSVSLMENSPVDDVVFRVTVTDQDQGGFEGSLRILPESVPFSIDPDGTVRVNDSSALDRETTESFTFQIEATEKNPPNNVRVVNVTVTLLDENDNNPVFTSKEYQGRVFANQTAGMELVQVQAEDQDVGTNGEIKYSIDYGNDDNYFSIQGDTGAITLDKTIPMEENRTLEFILIIKATDGGVISRSSSVEVKIYAPGDSKPQFLNKVYHGTIEEEQDPGAVILRVDYFAIGDSIISLQVETEADKFSISPSGELTTKVKLDYDEAPHSYSVGISISDGVNSDTAVVEVQVTDINDNSPAFSSHDVTASVPEDEELGFNVTVVPATDKDSGFNKEIRYWLRGGEGKFTVDRETGTVSVAGALDRETMAQYNLEVVAEDQGRPARSATASLLVQVLDINDNAPRFSQAEYQVEVSETGSVGTSLLTLSAVDPDDGVNGAVTYSIVEQSPSSVPAIFELDTSNGTLLLVQPLDYSKVKEYRLLVQASDGGTPSLVGTSSVVVKVQDMNNNPPEFSQESYNVSVFENLPSGSSILTVEVLDRDEGGFVGSLRVIPDSVPFSVSVDGTITVTNSTALDREITDKITFQVDARDTEQPHHVATATVSVTLLDENDNNPKFTSSSYESQVFSNQTEGMSIVKVEAQDPDAGVNGQIKYSIDFGNQNDHFVIDENTGVITLKKLIPMQAHQTSEFFLFITATDGGAVSRSASAQVKILAVGETRLQFTQSTYSVTTEEERGPGTVILKVEYLTTGETPVTLQVETEADKFNISSSGELTTKVKLDYDEAPHSYSVMISISDGVNSDTAVVEVQVTDINDNSPAFSSHDVTASVPEDAELGFNVTVVPATDKDSGFNKEIRYWLRGGEGKFTVDRESGTVSVAGALDRETMAQYNLEVVAEDQGRPARSAIASLLVQVLDINDNVPKFSQAEYQVEVSETGPVGTSLLTLSAVDPDDGVNGAVTYSIVEQSPSSVPAIFELDSSNGTLQLVQPLDYSKVKEYRLLVQASDGGTPSLDGNSSVVVKVKDVSNNPPEFSQESYNVSVSENLPTGSFILNLEVTDRDEGGFVGSLRVIPDSVPFSVSIDGTITVTNSTALDREITDKITFQVEARETEQPDHVATATVSVTLLDENDNNPKFTSSSYESQVFSNQAEGMSVVKVEAQDPDAGVNGQIKYSIDFGNQNDHFVIDENTGVITLKKLIPMQANQTSEFLLFITATDGGAVSRSASAQVKILAVGETRLQFTQSTYSVTTEEERDPGTVILKVDYLTAGETPVTLQVETEADKFNISSSGELTTKVKLDYDEAPHSYSVRISISDGVNSDTAVVEVQVTDINDNSPAFSSHDVTASVPEDAELGFNVTVVPAIDIDSGFNKEIRYWLRGGEGKFTVDRESGTVSVAGALDRETMAQYNLEVVAEDQGRPARSATASLLVQVLDINDNVPKFSQAEYQVEVSETGPVGTSLLTLSAVDPDDGVNGAVTYSIVEQSPSSVPAIFELDSSNGTLQLVQPLDYSKVKEYRLLVQASDGGTPSLVGNSSVVVKVKDVNNNPPEFSQESYNVSVSENLPSGSSILTLEVTDRDEGGFINGYFLYSSDTFDINKQGVVSLMKNVTLDRETKDHFVLQVVAVDQATDGLNSTAQLNITVLDYNDNAPQFPEIPDPLQISEGDYTEAAPGEVFSIVPTDADVGLNGEVTVSLASPHPLFRFREDSMLLAVGSLDRESRETYELIIKASDKGSPQRESFTTVRVNLTDVNDNSPEFSSSSYVSSILLKDAVEGKLLLTLSATDRDVGSNALITYSFSAGNSPYLALNSVTGAVTLTSDLAGITEDTTLELTATAVDHGQPPLSSTASVMVNLRIPNTVEGVFFINSSYSFILLENQPAGAAVGRVFATSGSDLYNVTYSLKTQTDVFNISADGTIQTRVMLDKERREWYVLDVEAVDTRTPPTSAVTKVSVLVQDVNEAPEFLSEVYSASVFSNAPYKTPIVLVQASDPDVGESAQLVYTMSGGTPYFDVEPSTGLVYLVSVAGLEESKLELMVTATDPRGLLATARVEVEVTETASSNNVVVISLNQPKDTVDEKSQELEKALGGVLGWTVSIIAISDADRTASQSKMLREEMRTLVSFIATDDDQVVSSEDVIEKLDSHSDEVEEALAEVFQADVDFEVESDSERPQSDDTAVVILGVLLALSLLALICAVAFLICFKRKHRKDHHSDSRQYEGYMNDMYGDPKEAKSGDTNPKDNQRRKDSDETAKTDRDSLTLTQNRDSNGPEEFTSV